MAKRTKKFFIFSWKPCSVNAPLIIKGVSHARSIIGLVLYEWMNKWKCHYPINDPILFPVQITPMVLWKAVCKNWKMLSSRQYSEMATKQVWMQCLCHILSTNIPLSGWFLKGAQVYLSLLIIFHKPACVIRRLIERIKMASEVAVDRSELIYISIDSILFNI